MMHRARRQSAAVALAAALPALLAVFISSATTAQWSDDPELNLSIADRASDQVVQKVASTVDGGTYVGWFDLASGNYDVYLQLLDHTGVEQFPHNGLLISDHPQNSWLVDWDLIADSSGNAVLVFADARDGSDLDIHAYRVSAAGAMLWGADGVTLSANDDFEPAPRVTETGDNHFTFVWARLPDAADGTIMMQRLSADGVPQLAPGGVPIVSVPGESPSFVDITSWSVVPDPHGAAGAAGATGGAGAGGAAAAGGAFGDVIVSWVRDITNFASPRHVRAERFSPAATSVWGGHVDVYDATSVPIAYTPNIQTNGGGGAILWWHASENNLFNSRVQVLNEDGVELFPHNGVAVSTTPNRHHIDPTLSYAVQTGEIFVFWNERNPAQSQWGIYGQKLVLGTRMWTDGGVELLPVDGSFKYGPRTAPFTTGFPMLFLVDEPTGTFGENRVLGMRVDTAGNLMWPDSPLVVSSLLSGKSRLTLTEGLGVAKLVWEDDRTGSVDLYGQNVNPDGTLGQSTTGVGPAAAAPAHFRLLQNRPNPFALATDIPLMIDGALSGARIMIYDAAGRAVRRLAVGTAGLGERRVAWDGRDELGQPVAAGVYFYRLQHAGGAGATRKAIVAR